MMPDRHGGLLADAGLATLERSRGGAFPGAKGAAPAAQGAPAGAPGGQVGRG